MTSDRTRVLTRVVTQAMDGEYLATSYHHFQQDGNTASFNACNNADYMKWMG